MIIFRHRRIVFSNTSVYFGINTENPCRAMNHIELKPETFTPVSKNPIIAKFFMNIGFADELGSGTRNIFKYTKLYSGKTPKMIEDDIFRTEIPLDENFSSEFGAVSVNDVNSNNTNETENLDISETQKEILSLIKNDKKITASKIAEKLNFSSRAIEQNLKELRNKKIIERLGAKKNGIWKVL